MRIGRFSLLLLSIQVLVLVFSTSAGEPAASTRSAIKVRSSSAMLKGVAVSGEDPCQAWFEWGVGTVLDQSSPVFDVGAGADLTQLSFELTNLVPRAVYTFRLVASNEHGVFPGARRLFNTGKKVAVWGGSDQSVQQIPAGLSNLVSIAAGGAHMLALLDDGTVKAWGQNASGQIDVPSDATNVVGVFADGGTSVVLRENGLLRGWGDNTRGQVNIPSEATNIVAFDMANGQCVAVRGDGSLVSWGTQTNGPGPVPTGLSNVVEIACGPLQNLALRADGTLLQWPTPSPAEVTNVAGITSGHLVQLAILIDGTVKGWDSSSVLLNDFPADLTNVVQAAAGGAHYLALSATGAVLGWGQTNYGALAIPSGIEPVAVVAAGTDFSAALGANLLPQAAPQTINGPPNDDLVIKLPASDQNGDAMRLRIVTLPERGTLFQYSAGSRGAAIMSVDTEVMDEGWRVIFAPATNSAGAPYAHFRFTVNDGGADALVPAEVTVNIFGNTAGYVLPPASISTGGVTLAGMAFSGGLPSTAWFEWGPNFQERSTIVDLAGSETPEYLRAEIGALAQSMAWQARLVVSNSQGVALGHPRRFTTGLKVHAWGRNDQGAASPPAGTSRVIHIAGNQSSGTTGHFSVAVRDNGSLVAWGTNNAGQLNVPAGVTNAVMVAAGGAHGLALCSDGVVITWGSTNNGLSRVPVALTNVVDVAAGRGHSLALTRAGRVVAWGANESGQTNVPPGLEDAVAISAFEAASYALRGDGTVLGWGTAVNPGISNAVALGGKHAILRDGSLIFLAPGSGPTPGNYAAVASGNTHAIVLGKDGTVTGEGYNLFGGASIPSGLREVAVVGAGRDHSLAIGANTPPTVSGIMASIREGAEKPLQLRSADKNGDNINFLITTLPSRGVLYQYAVGGRGPAITATNTMVSDDLGRVLYVTGPSATNSPYDRFEFVGHDGEDASNVGTVTLFMRGEQFVHTSDPIDVRTDRVTCRGFVTPNGYSTHAWFELRSKSGGWVATEPRDVGTTNNTVWLMETVTGLVGRVPYFCRLVASNETGITFGAEKVFGRGRSLFLWGANNIRQLQPYLPEIVDYTAVACGTVHSLILRSDGKLNSWGDGGYNQQNIPANLSNIVSIAAASTRSVALKRDGTIVAWGGGYINLTIPASYTNIMAVAIGANHGIALRTNGEVMCWGQNAYGQTNVPKGLSNVVAVTAGDNHNLALRNDGTVAAWGQNSSGQTNVPFWLSEVVGVAASGSGSYAILRDGGIVAWGAYPTNYSVPPRATPCLALTPSANFDIALRSDLEIVGWGTNNNGQISIPNGISNAISVAAGSQHAMALSVDPIGPYANTVPATVYEHNAFRLGGFVTPNDEAAVSWFEWGNLKSFDRVIGITNLDAERGFTFVKAVVTEIEPGVVYNYRIAASNRLGVVRGATQLFGVGNQVVYWGNTNGLNGIGTIGYVRGLEGMVGLSVLLNTTRVLFSSGYLMQGGDSISVITGAVAMAAGPGMNAAVLEEGTVAHESNSIQSRVPNITNAVAVAGGLYHFLALSADGLVTRWTTAPSMASNLVDFKQVVGVAVGERENVILRADGKVFFGTNMVQGMDGVVAVPTVHRIASGRFYALRGDGKVLRYDQNSPFLPSVTEVTGVSNCVALTGGYNGHLIALSSEGTLQGFGTMAQANVPEGLSNVMAVASGDYAAVALLAGTPAPLRAVTSPATVIRSNTAVLNAWIAPHWTVASAWFEWGGDSSMGHRTPIRLISERGALKRLSETILDISPGVVYHVRVVASNDQGVVYGNERVFGSGWKVAVWGDKKYGQLEVPRPLRNVTSLAAGEEHTIALTMDGFVKGWGRNDQGQVAIPSGLSGVVSVGCGDHLSMAVTEDSRVTQWGYHSLSPSFSDVVAVDAGYDKSYAQLSGGKIQPWQPATTTPISPEVVDFSAQEWYGVAVQGNGTINYFGSAYPGDPQLAPLGGLTDVAAVAVGNHTVMAVHDGGAVDAWGQFDYGQSVIPAGLNRAVAVAAGEGHCLALKADGTVYAWGLNADGQTEVPQGLTNVVAIAAGAFHSVAVGANVPPKAMRLQLALPHREPLIINLAAVDPNNDPLTFIIRQLPSEGRLFQCENGLIGAAITGSGTMVDDPAGRVVFVPASVGQGDLAITFVYGVRDDETFGFDAEVSIRSTTPEPAIVTSFGWATNGAFRITFSGDSNLTQCVQVSTNLVDWELLGIAAPVSAGMYQILDVTAVNYPERFYRVDSGCVPARAQIVGLAKVSPGTFKVRFNGAPNARYRVWASADLEEWTPMGYAKELEPGLFQYLDTQTDGVARRFYKAGPN